MDEDNAPMAFPNGYVYSREVRTHLTSQVDPPHFILLTTFHDDQALEYMSAQNEGKVKCPRTQEECDFSKLKKVFIS
jgi:macrophage erythroblast attacher